MCRLAYCGFFKWHRERKYDQRRQKNPKVIFTENDLINSGIEVTDNFNGHGLLCVETLYDLTEDCVMYNFIHLSMQEFLCAVFMLTLPQEEQHHLLQDYFDIYPNIISLYCGLTKSDFHYSIVYSKLKSPSSAVTAVKCLYEGQLNTTPYQSTSPIVLDMNDRTLLPYDCVCLSYVYTHYPITQLKL